MENYETLVDATNDLLKKGYTANLILDNDSINDNERHIKMLPDEFEIDGFYRFEGQSNPSDMSIVYAISSEKYTLKGVLVNAYGVYADNASAALVAKLHHNQISEHLHGQDRPKE